MSPVAAPQQPWQTRPQPHDVPGHEAKRNLRLGPSVVTHPRSDVGPAIRAASQYTLPQLPAQRGRGRALPASPPAGTGDVPGPTTRPTGRGLSWPRQPGPRVGGGISVPAARLSSLLLKACPGPDESRRRGHHPAPSWQAPGSFGGAGGPPPRCTPSLQAHGFAPLLRGRQGPGSAAAHGAGWGEMRGLCGSLAANEFPGKEAKNVRGMSFPSAGAAGPSFTGK